MCRAAARSAGPASRSAPRSASTSTSRTRSSRSTVGNIILATGYEVFDAAQVERYGYGTLPNVLTALEFERLTNASGPTGGKIVMKALKPQQAQEESTSGSSTPRGPAAEERRDHPLRRLARPQPQRVLLARLLHVLAEVRAPGPREAARRQLLRVLHRHARLRKGLRGVPRAHQGRGRPRRPRPHRQGRARATARWSSRAKTSSATSWSISPSTWSSWPSAWCRPTDPTSWPGCWASPRTRTAGSASSTTTPTPPTRSAAASSSPASARDRRTSPTRWRRPRRWPPACSRASYRPGVGSRADLSLADIEARAAQPRAEV